jgi:GTP cyclohydrolase III
VCRCRNTEQLQSIGAKIFTALDRKAATHGALATTTRPSPGVYTRAG